MENVEIKTIQRVLSEMKFLKERSFPTSKDFENYIIIVESLEKQMPKQVGDIIGDYENNYDCPICRTITKFEHQKYCIECGQRLEW